MCTEKRKSGHQEQYSIHNPLTGLTLNFQIHLFRSLGGLWIQFSRSCLVYLPSFSHTTSFFSHCAFKPSRSDVMSSRLGELLLSEPSRYLSVLENCEFSTATRASPGGFSYVPLLTNFTFHLKTTMNFIILSSFIYSISTSFQQQDS